MSDSEGGAIIVFDGGRGCKRIISPEVVSAPTTVLPAVLPM